ncbi:uncharacterized protein LOC143921385 isoform X2 [Arctopsyche grandis]
MGIKDPKCDDGKHNLEIDWLDDAENYTCLDSKLHFIPNYKVHPILEIDDVPPVYHAAHACMDKPILYDDLIPTFGTHRPLWPEWGEYMFLPKQRWLHSAEHGGIIMLYHPCANKHEVSRLKAIVRQCLYRYVITPYNLMPAVRPLALVVWGKKLEMSVVSTNVVVKFIKENALRGPEQLSKDGQYSHGLIKHAKTVTTEDDAKLCPYL